MNNEIKIKPTKLSIEAAELELDKDACLLDKIEELRNCLTAVVVETTIGIESYRPVFDESEAATLKGKLFELIHKL